MMVLAKAIPPAQKKIQIKTMKSYTIHTTGKSAIAAALATQLAPGKAGESLIRNGFSQGSFCAFLAELATRAIAAGYDSAKLADLFRQMAGGNASQARKACAELVIKIDGDKTGEGLEAYWKAHFSDGAAPIDTAALEAL